MHRDLSPIQVGATECGPEVQKRLVKFKIPIDFGGD